MLQTAEYEWTHGSAASRTEHSILNDLDAHVRGPPRCALTGWPLQRPAPVCRNERPLGLGMV